MYQTITRFLGDLFGGTLAPLTATGGSKDYGPLEMGSESSKSAYDAWTSHQPAFNTDGTPMMGDFDANGHVFGQTHSASNPDFNIDGTPMMGDFDANGHIYGDPAPALFQADGGNDGTSWSSFDLGSSFSSSDSWNASSSCGSGDTFDPF